MSKWIGIRVSAVLTILGSALTLLAAASMAWTAFRAQAVEAPAEPPFPVKAVLAVMALFFAACSVWGVASAIGIFRRRGWARLSMIVFACLLVGMGVSALAAILFIQMPDTPNVPPATLRNIRLGIAAFYGSMAVIGAWWLLLFNSNAAKQYFADRPPAPGARPLSVSIIGWYVLASALGTAVGAILQVPAVLFGVVVTGWAAAGVYTALTAVQIYLGSGLLQLQEPARVASMCYFAIIGLNSAAMGLLPGFGARMQSLLEAMPAFMRSPNTVNLQGSAGPMLMGTLLMAVAIWFLVRRRAAFHG